MAYCLQQAQYLVEISKGGQLWQRYRTDQVSQENPQGKDVETIRLKSNREGKRQCWAGTFPRPVPIILKGKIMKLRVAGPVPERIFKKAQRIIEADQLRQGAGWKKINRRSDWSSYRLNTKFRLLCGQEGPIYICKHEIHEKKIRTL